MFLNMGDSFRRVIFAKRDSSHRSYISLFIPKLEKSHENFEFPTIQAKIKKSCFNPVPSTFFNPGRDDKYLLLSSGNHLM